MQTTNDNIGDKIIKGAQLAYEKLVQEKAKANASLVFSENGKIIHVKAKKLLRQMERQCV